MKPIRIFLLLIGILCLLGHVYLLVFNSVPFGSQLNGAGLKVAGLAARGLANDPLGKWLLILLDSLLIFALIKIWMRSSK